MKIRIKFRKQGAMKFIGHLDIMRYFQKAIRRADIDIVYTEGFSPHMIMSFAAPLGVGLTSDGEYVDIMIHGSISSKEAVRRLNAVMVEGMEVLSFRQVPEEKASKAMSLVASADYTLRFREGKKPSPNWETELMEFCKRPSIKVMKQTKKSEKEIDIRPLIYDIRTENGTIFMHVSTGSTDNLKPEFVIEAFCREYGYELSEFALLINRVEVYDIHHVTLEDLGEEIAG